MKEKNTNTKNGHLPVILLTFTFLITAIVPTVMASFQEVPQNGNEELDEAAYPLGYDPDTDPLVKAGFRPRFSSTDSQFIQTPSPVPDDAVMHPYGWTPSSTMSTSSRANWDTHYEDEIITVKVDIAPTSRFPNGDLSTQEEQLLDRIIDDFKNFSWPRVKDYFDPLDKIIGITFLIHDIDGPSGTGGYYQPGTDEFHLDRSDFSWGGVIAAHEFQHYCHRQYDINENLWVDEGFADYGAYLVYGITSAISTHIYAYLQYRPLHSVVVDDYTFYQDTTTSYYGSSFLFQMYLIEEYGGMNYTHGTVRSAANGINGINAGLQASGTSDRFEEAFSKFMVALRVNDDYAGENGEYAFDEKSYSYGSVRLPLTKSHSSYPVSADLTGPGILTYSVNSIRFASPPEAGETYKLDLEFSAGNPVAAIYYESNPPRSVEHINFGNYRSRSIEITGWGTQFSAFQLILSSSAASTVHYELDVLDLIAPVTTLSLTPFVADGEDGWYTTPPRISLSTGESRDNIYYRLNGGEEQTYNDPFYIYDGVWNLTYHSVDRHGNIEGFRFMDLKVDTDSPTTSMSVDPDMPEDTWYTETPVITLNTAHPNTVILYKFNNDDFKVYEGPINPPEGVSNFFWKSIDQAGNMENEKSRSFKLDSIAPTMFYSIEPESPNGMNEWYVSTPTVTLDSDDSEILYYSINGGSFQTYMAPFPVPDGINEIKLLPMDQAGNKGDEIRFEVKVDTNEPEMYGFFEGWAYEDDNSSQWLDFAPVLTIDGSEDGMVINYTLNDGSPVDYTKPIQTQEGIVVINVQGKDKAGNEAPPLRYFLKIDMRNPTVVANVQGEQVNGWYLDSDVKVTLDLVDEKEDASTVKIEYSWKSDSETMIYRGPITVPEGSSTLFYWAMDLAGNGMESKKMDFNKDSMAPALALNLEGPVGNSVDVGSEVLIDLSSSSDENGVKFYSVNFFGSSEPEWSAGVSFAHVYNEPGTYNITAQVKDNAGNIQEKVVQIVVNPVEVIDNSTQAGSNSNSDMIVMGVIVIIVVMVILVAVLIVAIAKKRNNPHHHHHQHPAHHHHPHKPLGSQPAHPGLNGNGQPSSLPPPPPPKPPTS